MSCALPPLPVEVWHVRLPDQLRPEDLALLDPEEHARATAISMPAHRVQYVAAHAALRRILGAASGCAPDALRFLREAHGRPVLQGRNAPHFSLSHSGADAAIALCRHAPLGVDLEQRRARPRARQLVARLFAEPERARLLPLRSAEFDAAFARLWVLKEAYIKADGRGLACPLDSFAIDPFAPRLLCSDMEVPIRPQLSYKELCNNIDSALVVWTAYPVEIKHRVLDMRVDLGRAA
jgi:4'-phosphopantetheinyl transferase